MILKGKFLFGNKYEVNFSSLTKHDGTKEFLKFTAFGKYIRILNYFSILILECKFECCPDTLDKL